MLVRFRSVDVLESAENLAEKDRRFNEKLAFQQELGLTRICLADSRSVYVPQGSEVPVFLRGVRTENPAAPKAVELTAASVDGEEQRDLVMSFEGDFARRLGVSTECHALRLEVCLQRAGWDLRACPAGPESLFYALTVSFGRRMGEADIWTPGLMRLYCLMCVVIQW